LKYIVELGFRMAKDYDPTVGQGVLDLVFGRYGYKPPNGGGGGQITVERSAWH
jgi:hypothetical protein